MQKKYRTKVIYICLSSLVILCLFTVYFAYRYPGFTHMMINQMRYATLKENMNLTSTIYYWLSFMEKLRLEDQTGFYTFDHVARDFDHQRHHNDFARGQVAYHQGLFAKAITHIERDIKRHGESETRLFWLALSYMRQAEAENCLSQLSPSGHPHQPASPSHATNHHHSKLCTLPLTQFHDKKSFSQTSAQLFQKLLSDYSPDNHLYQWLLNLSYMTIDGFPDQVPPEYRVNTKFISTFYGQESIQAEKNYKFLIFEDRARELGVDTHDTGRGVAVEDFDKDGYLDIVTGGSFQDVKYYKNNRGTHYINQTDAVGLKGITQPFVITAADYDNDSWIDLFFCRPFDHFLLFRNNQDGTFTNVTQSSGLLDSKPDTQIAATWIPAWGDVDNDGDLDLFLAQWALKLPFVKGIMGLPRMDSKLFLNEHGRFVDQTRAYGLHAIVADRYYIGATFGDYDDDGYADLFLSSPVRNSNVLLRNVKGQRFENTHLIRRTEPGFVAAFVDVNHDGKLDIFQGGFGDAHTNTAQAVFGEHVSTYQSGHSTIHVQMPSGHFDERNDFFRGNMPMSTMGASYGDLNNDGCYDFYLGTGNPEGWFILPNLMYIGERDQTTCTGYMTNISMLNGFGTLQKGHGIVFFDFDHDGDQDIYSSLGGMWPGDRWPNQFFVNQSQLNHQWVKIRLRGRQTNHFGIGATIHVKARNARGQPILRYHYMHNTTGFGSAPYLAHIGLLDASRIDLVTVDWPGSKQTKTYQATLGRLNILDEYEGVAHEAGTISTASHD